MDSKLIVGIAIVVVAILAFIIYLAWQIKKKGLRQTAVDLIVYAEANFKNNNDKFDYCVDQLIKLIPAPLSFFVTDEMVCNFVQKIFDLVKNALDYQEEVK